MRKVLMASVLTLAMLFAATGGAASPPDEKSAAPPALKIKVGDMAPDFTLEDQSGNKVSLHDFRGKKNVALAFYIFAFTGG